MKFDLHDIVIKILMLVLGIILIIMIILKLIGSSPTTDSIFGVAIGLLITAVYHLTYKVGRIESKLDNLASQFSALAKDFKEYVRRKR